MCWVEVAAGIPRACLLACLQRRNGDTQQREAETAMPRRGENTGRQEKKVHKSCGQYSTAKERKRCIYITTGRHREATDGQSGGGLCLPQAECSCFSLLPSAWLCLALPGFFLRAPLEPVSVAITTFFWLTSGSTNRVWLATAEKCADISAARVRSELISYGAVEWSGAGRKGEQGEKEKRKRGMLGGQKEREKKEQRKKLS